MRILVIEDEKPLAYLIRRGLTEDGYAVDIAYDGDEGQYFAEDIQYDLIVLDIVLPKKDGFAVCQELRREKVNTRILMLTCRDSISDRVKGLDSGADDYLIKPFAFNELSARIRALLRRDLDQGSPIIQTGEISLNTVTREVKRGNQEIVLTSKEYAILEYFMRNPKAILTRQMIENHIWNLSLDTESNVINVYIGRLRNKLNVKEEDGLIETIKGAGYRWRME
ncbi:MAG: response regulator transcription factor [Dehalococcoidales bacterium]